jgi:Mrp family chromosome partitioning ATPase
VTRIFDALRKVQSSREPAASAPGPAPVPAARPRAAAPVPGAGPATRPLVLPPGVTAALPEDVVREMTTLRVGVEAALPDRSPRVVMFASSQGGEGTSTVVMQFALTLAQDAELRTLLVDLHARRPAHPATPVAVGGEGTAVAHLDVLPFADTCSEAGFVVPAEARQAIETTSAGYDWVIVDGPPVLESPDSASLGAVVDGVVLIVQAGRTKRPVVTRAVDLLRKAGGRVLGTVLNRRRLEIPGFIYRRI